MTIGTAHTRRRFSGPLAHGFGTCKTYLDAEVASVDIIAEEEVSSIGRVTADLEKLHEIEILAVHVAADGDWGIHFQEIGFTFQYLGTLFDDVECLLFGKPALAAEVLFEELQVWLGAIMGREELVLCRGLESWGLDV